MVALGGGVDSGYLTVRGQRVLGGRAVGVTADSPSVASGQRETALALARDFGFVHRIVLTSEVEDPLYARNDANRCFHCKTELFRHLLPIAAAEGYPHVAYGAIVDDLSHFPPRPRPAATAP